MFSFRILCAAALSLPATAAVAVPLVEPEILPIEQDGASKTVTISYRLDGDDGIVTVDIQTNAPSGAWVSIGGTHLLTLSGDVNKAVAGGGAAHTVRWNPYETWPVKEKVPMRAVVRAWATNAQPNYMALDLGQGTRRFYASAEEVPGGVQDRKYKTDVLLMRKIPAACVPWRMGAGSANECGTSDYAKREKPHEITLTADYYFGVYPLTQRQYYLIHENGKGSYADVPDGNSPSSYKGADADIHPVERICYTYLRGSSAWPDSGHTIASGDMGRILGRARTLTGVQLDLPTEAQWEFAARGGVGSAYVDGTSTWKDSLGWTSSNADYDGKTRAVGLGAANDWGIYDLHGNVWEICLDWYDEGYYLSSPSVDPPGAASSTYNNRSTRGGCYSSDSSGARLSKRGYNRHDATGLSTLGARLVCPAVVPGI